MALINVMIHFSCRCRTQLQAPDNHAGLSMQCPSCGLLVDVPTMAEKDLIAPDGTYQLEQPLVQDSQQHLDELKLIYYPGRHLSDGSEIDLRGSVAPEPGRADISGPPSPDPLRPKYDPDTGELIEPLALDGPGSSSSLSIPEATPIPQARRIINYNVSSQALEGVPHGMAIFAALFQPVNLFVMGIILAAHLLLVVSAVVTSVLPMMFVSGVFLLMFIGGHYVNVFEEIGPCDRDELPRPLRNVNPFDDFLFPAARMLLTLILCYWPLSVVHIPPPDEFLAHPGIKSLIWPALWVLLGGWFFPAVFLTICASGAIGNARPDRILRLMLGGGWRYAGLAIIWIAASAIYLLGSALTITAALLSFLPGPSPILFRSAVVLPVLSLGIYLMHAFCWFLGMYYRRHWEEFPWAAQVHEPSAGGGSVATWRRRRRGAKDNAAPSSPEGRKIR